MHVLFVIKYVNRMYVYLFHSRIIAHQANIIYCTSTRL